MIFKLKSGKIVDLSKRDAIVSLNREESKELIDQIEFMGINFIRFDPVGNNVEYFLDDEDDGFPSAA